MTTDTTPTRLHPSFDDEYLTSLNQGIDATEQHLAGELTDMKLRQLLRAIQSELEDAAGTLADITDGLDGGSIDPYDLDQLVSHVLFEVGRLAVVEARITAGD